MLNGGSMSYAVTGTGTGTLSIKINGQLYYTAEINFDKETYNGNYDSSYSGSAEEEIDVSKLGLVGKTLGEAKAILEKNGLHYTIANGPEDDSAIVESFSPNSAAAGATIALTTKSAD